MKITNRICLLMLTIVVFVSCQREPPVFTDPPRVEFDSTLLIKSVESVYDNGAEVFNTTESYFYDTANRKIHITWNAINDPDFDGMSAVFSYNTKGLLTGIDYSYLPTYDIGSFNYSTVSIAYDNDDVLKTVVLNFVQSPSVQLDFTRTAASSGYTLEWETPYDDPFPTPGRPVQTGTLSRLTFNSSRQCIKYEPARRQVDAGVDIVTPFILEDSLVYDAAGSLSKVYRTYQGNESLAVEFESRHTKGDQLSNFRGLLLNGLNNIPFPEGQSWYWFSILCISPDAYEKDQYSGFPIKTAKVSDTPFTATSTFDNLDRLTEYKGFFSDLVLDPQIFKINYYK